jgi:hypothetical protein
MNFMKPVLAHTTLQHVSHVLLAVRIWIWSFTGAIYTLEVLIVHIFPVLYILAPK